MDLPNRMTVQQRPTRLEYQQVIPVARSGTAALVGARSVEVSLQVVRSEEEALLLGRGGLLQGRLEAAWGGRDPAQSRPESGAGGGGWSGTLAPSSWDSGMCSVSQQG